MGVFLGSGRRISLSHSLSPPPLYIYGAYIIWYKVLPFNNKGLAKGIDPIVFLIAILLN